MDQPKGYSATQIGLHWVIAGLIALQFLLNEGIATAWDAREAGTEAVADITVPLHVYGGIAVLGLALWRLGVRLLRGAPAAPAQEPALMQKAGHVAHWALYLLILVIPVSGLLAWFGEAEAAAEAHEVLTSVLMVLVGLHVLAALYHQFILRTNLLARMKRPSA